MPAQCLFFLSNRNFREYSIIIQYASPTVKVVKPNLLPFFYFGGKKKEPSYALPQVTSRSVETDDFGEELTPKSVLPRRPLSPPPPPSLLPAQRCAAAVRGTRMCTRRTRTTGPGPYLYCTVPVTRCNQSTAATGEGSLCRVIAARGDRAAHLRRDEGGGGEIHTACIDMSMLSIRSQEGDKGTWVHEFMSGRVGHMSYPASRSGTRSIASIYKIAERVYQVLTTAIVKSWPVLRQGTDTHDIHT